MTTRPPADVGMPVAEIDTPALVVDLDAYEQNLDRMAASLAGTSVRLRGHAKTHKSPVVALHQMARGAVGACCQKVSEAEAMVYGGVRNILVSNEVIGVTDPNGSHSGMTYDALGRPLLSLFSGPGGALNATAARSYVGFEENATEAPHVVVKMFTDPVPQNQVWTSEGRLSTTYIDELGRTRYNEVALGDDRGIGARHRVRWAQQRGGGRR